MYLCLCDALTNTIELPTIILYNKIRGGYAIYSKGDFIAFRFNERFMAKKDNTSNVGMYDQVKYI